MKNAKLTIENENYSCFKNDIKECITDSKKTTAEKIAAKFPAFKSGFGGSHVWVSLPNNERIAIINF